MTTAAKQLDNGVTVHQVTDDPQLKDNIYCERSYCTPDARWFVYQVHVDDRDCRPYTTNVRFIACALGTWEQRELAHGYSYPEIAPSGRLYFTRDRGLLASIDIATGARQDHPIDGGIQPLTGMTISPCERYIAYGVHVSGKSQMFGVEVADLQTASKRIVCRDPYICNPHAQFHPDDAKTLMIQHNRGCAVSPNGTIAKWLGPEGATLFDVNVHTGAITRWPVGPPYTTSITGHQQWIASTRGALATLQPDGDAPTLVIARSDGAPQAINNLFCNHVNVSPCGRYYCCDIVATGDIHVGSIRTGRHAWLCNAGPLTEALGARFGQSSHVHPYLSPDLKWVVFNTCTTGRPQIAVASVPPPLLASLD